MDAGLARIYVAKLLFANCETETAAALPPAAADGRRALLTAHTRAAVADAEMHIIEPKAGPGSSAFRDGERLDPGLARRAGGHGANL